MFKNSLIVTALSLLGAGISLLNQLIMAKTFGLGHGMDAFLAGSSLPTLLAGLVAAALNYSLAPYLVTRRAEDAATFPTDAGTLHSTLLVFGLGVFGLGAIFPGPCLHLISPHLPAATFTMALPISRLAWITGIATISQVFLSCSLNVAGRFLAAASAGLLPYLGMGAATFFTGGRLGPYSTALGLLGGTFLAALLLAPTASRYIRPLAWRRKAWPQTLAFLGRMPLVVLSMLCFTVYQTIDAFWAPRLGEGCLSALGYNQRMLIAAGNLIIAGPSAVLMPRLAEAYLKEDKTEFQDLAQTAVRLVMSFSSLIAVMLIILRKPLVALLFGRGAFDAAAQDRVTSLMPYMLVGMVAMLCVVIMFRILFAQRSIFGPIVIGVGCTGTYFLLSGLLSIRFGIIGIGLAYVISWTTGVILGQCSFASSRKHRSINQWPPFLLKLSLALFITFLGSLGISALISAAHIPAPPSIKKMIVCGVTLILGFGIFTATAMYIFKIQEIKDFIQNVANKIIAARSPRRGRNAT